MVLLTALALCCHICMYPTLASSVVPCKISHFINFYSIIFGVLSILVSEKDYINRIEPRYLIITFGSDRSFLTYCVPIAAVEPNATEPKCRRHHRRTDIIAG